MNTLYPHAPVRLSVPDVQRYPQRRPVLLPYRYTSWGALSSLLVISMTLSLLVGLYGAKVASEVSVATQATNVAPRHTQAPIPALPDPCLMPNVRCAKASSVESQIRALAARRGFRWPDYLVRLARYESSLNPNATRVNTNGTVDRGLFQWNRTYHPEITDQCAYDTTCSTLAAMDAINDGNQHWWVANNAAMVL